MSENSAFATAEDLAARWRALSGDEADRAAVLLADASVYLRAVCARHEVDAEERAEALKIVCCDLVQRKMQAPDGSPVSSVTQAGGPYSATVSYAVQSRKFRLYDEDYEMLGIRRGGIARMVPVAIHDPGGDVVWPR